MTNQMVTTSLNASKEMIIRAKKIAAELNINYVPRNGMSLPDLESQYSGSGILVVSKNRLSVYIKGEEFFFHPGMAKLRIKQLKNGHTDQMISAMNLNYGDSVLDCTLGLGSDAVVANYVTGGSGRVTGLEINPLMAYVVKDGIERFQNPSPTLVKAVKGINIINTDHKKYLKNLPDNSFDVVYFDPMFRNPVYKSAGMVPLRKLANHDPLAVDSVEEACRVARKRVVIKERYNSEEFERLGCEQVVGGKKSPIAYGVIVVGRDNN
ncbi:16S rRNA G966 N2-methylase RsmD [Desulfohalotomaculum tongense]|uniref:class I SAM-dependent methyltransferase n=1 Tax=Desulforadius tongensis TaxID=1216062 RepID=UPI00195E4DA3|nr:class I SAM-dependent methyltransferase [Desulforadius tongensis]MBM7854142.1 16S rRNA G966 N2-methylase RsmD [Desulforadius tongensis]